MPYTVFILFQTKYDEDKTRELLMMAEGKQLLRFKFLKFTVVTFLKFFQRAILRKVAF